MASSFTTEAGNQWSIGVLREHQLPLPQVLTNVGPGKTRTTWRKTTSALEKAKHVGRARSHGGGGSLRGLLKGAQGHSWCPCQGESLPLGAGKEGTRLVRRGMACREEQQRAGDPRSGEGRRRRRRRGGGLPWRPGLEEPSQAPLKPGSEKKQGLGRGWWVGGAGGQTRPALRGQERPGFCGISREGPGKQNLTAGPGRCTLPSAGSCFD